MVPDFAFITADSMERSYRIPVLLYSVCSLVGQQAEQQNAYVLHTLYAFHLHLDADSGRGSFKKEQERMVSHQAHKNDVLIRN